MTTVTDKITNDTKRTLIFRPAVVGRVFADDETFSGKSDMINLLKQSSRPTSK